MAFTDKYTPVQGGEMTGSSAKVSKWMNKKTMQIVVIKEFQQRDEFQYELKMNQSLKGIHVGHAIEAYEKEKILVFEDLGNDLFNLVQNHVLDEYELLMIFKNVITSIVQLHKRHIFHGDIKLENIVVNYDQNGYLIDFGLSEVLDEKTKSSKPYGSTFYLAPESIKQEEHDLKADIYALGVAMYIALTGKLPFPGNTIFDYTISQITKTPIIQHLQNALVSQKVINVILMMMDPNPETRPTAQQCYSLLYGDDE